MTAGTLLLVPELDVQRTTVRRAYRSDRDKGRVLARQVQEREVRGWVLTWTAGHDGDRYLVRSLFDAAGTTLDMDWTPPGESATRVRFVDSPRFIARGVGLWRIECALEEVL